ncbi:MAG: VOC family protein [Saprospiraceae bacterium]|nr:VOC family protein [Saprospiraceae bacterium]
MQPRISMITLGVKDLAVSKSFYQNGLGWPALDSPPEVAFFNLNGTWLGLYNVDALAEDAAMKNDGTGFGRFSMSHNVKTEEEVDAIMEKAKNVGAIIVKQTQKAAWGGYHGYFQDPDGHLWEIAYNPFMWIGPED